MSIFLPDKGDKPETFIFLIEAGMESAATFLFMILYGLISLASHRKSSSGSVENKFKKWGSLRVFWKI